MNRVAVCHVMKEKCSLPVVHRGEFDGRHVLQAAKTTWLCSVVAFVPVGRPVIPLCFRPATWCKGKYRCFWILIRFFFVFFFFLPPTGADTLQTCPWRTRMSHLLGFVADSSPSHLGYLGIRLLMWILIRRLVLSAEGKNVGQMTFLQHSQPVLQTNNISSVLLFLSLTVSLQQPAFYWHCSVGLLLYLQSRFLFTFDNQIIYVIKKIQKYIFTCKVVGFRTSFKWSSEFLHGGFIGVFFQWMYFSICAWFFGELKYVNVTYGVLKHQH